MTTLADIGLIGLAVMGQNLALNISDHGFRVAVFNRTTSKVTRFIENEAAGTDIIGTYTPEEFVKSLKRPRKLILMIQAGEAVDKTIAQLLPLLDDGDIIIDGGNSNFRDSIRRTQEVEARGKLFIGAGISGGEEGARYGPSIMPGGSIAAWVGQADPAGGGGQSRGWHALLRLGGRRWRRALRQDGAQRH